MPRTRGRAAESKGSDSNSGTDSGRESMRSSARTATTTTASAGAGTDVTGGPVSPPALAPDPDRIAQRAYERFERRGGAPGFDQEDWFEAERELSGR